jgi:Glycosyl hydrolase family 115/Gylcosyl hydrolase family 115 C-terminal domain
MHMTRISFLALLLICSIGGMAQQMITAAKKMEGFPIAPGVLNIYADTLDDWLVNKAASLLQGDIEKITGLRPLLISNLAAASGNTIIIGTVGGSSAIKQLIAQKKINIQSIEGKWEAFQLETLKPSGKAITNTLVITGSDKRGAAYGVFELSRQLGVSPWYWWADVPVKTKTSAYIIPGVYTFQSPSVTYRGIFINDEAPAFSGWTREKFGGFNHLVYEKMFELLLRLKANYLWPAMWGNAFNDDDTLNPILANKWGIVMGTSHHEPMLRAQSEWKRYGKGAWDYTKNDTALKAFWKKGIENMGHHESIVTIGMRGDGDMPMTQGTATTLLENIVADQRKIIEEVTGQPAAKTPQLWALYKEVQDYYDKGMRVPDDITLLLCDDNWGNIRRLPEPGTPPRQGGFGIYYHFDYVGGPRNYKWLNTNNITRVWEQMHLAHSYGVNKIWIVNVGDLKPMEMPISFFLDYAYDTKKWNEDNISNFYYQWAREQFGEAYAKKTGNILSRYSFYAARRKPELLDANTYSLTVNGEFQKVVKEWSALKTDAEALSRQIPAEYKDAFFELVLHPVLALENLHQLYYAVARNKWNAAQKSLLANQWADKAKQYYAADSLLSVLYNTETAGGKWNHMMDQTHIGYRSWQEPRRNTIPALVYISSDSATNNPPAEPADAAVNATVNGTVFTENNGYISIGASHYSRAVEAGGISWKTIPAIGKNGDGITSFPVTLAKEWTAGSPHLQYNIITSSKDSVYLSLHFSPTLNFKNSSTGLRFAVSIDNLAPVVIGLNQEDNTGIWNSWVGAGIITKKLSFHIPTPGKHSIKYWMIDPGVILQHIVADFRNTKSGYLVPPETK